MSIITQLPSELLLDIFERLRHDPADLVNVIKTCQKWQRLGSLALYRHIKLQSKLRDDSKSARFATSITQCDLVHSFDLRLTQVHLMGFSILSLDAFDRLGELCDVLKSMRNLRTFALSFETSIGQGFSAPSATIVSLLNSLSKTVTNLSMDCECMRDPDLEQLHVCNVVGALLPRLHSLRLRTSHLCSGLLSSLSTQATLDPERPDFIHRITQVKTTSPLVHLQICLVLRPESGQGSHTNLCFSGNRPMQGASLMNTLHTLQKAGAFPLLRQFAVVGKVDARPTPQNDNWNVFKVRSLTRETRTTTTVPWCARGGSSSLYMIRDEYGDWFGSFDDITAALDGPLTWTNNGIKRRPLRENFTETVWQLDHSRLEPRKSVIEKFGVSFRLWKHEEAAKMKLLHSRTSPGFDDVTALSQLVPAGWRWVPEGPWNWTIAEI